RPTRETAAPVPPPPAGRRPGRRRAGRAGRQAASPSHPTRQKHPLRTECSTAHGTPCRFAPGVQALGEEQSLLLLNARTPERLNAWHVLFTRVSTDRSPRA